MHDLPAAIASRYKAIKIIGKGGFSTVWHCVQIDLERPVALKVLSEKALADQESVARFRHEAKVASNIDHPAVVSVLDFGVDGNIGYLAMPLIEGCTLRQMIRKGPLPVGLAMLVGIGLADALAEIHRGGVIHRDLKPENVLLADNERPMLTDFGISKSAGSVVQTREGIIFGTPGYVAPEQLEHEQAGPASDQYSLGVILFEMLAGRRPFKGETPAEEAMERVKKAPLDLQNAAPGIDPAVAACVMKMLGREPSDRFADMREVHRNLQVITMKLSPEDREEMAARPKTSAAIPLAGQNLNPSGSHKTPRKSGSSSHRVSRLQRTSSLTSLPVASLEVQMPRSGISPFRMLGAIFAGSVILALAGIAFLRDPTSEVRHVVNLARSGAGTSTLATAGETGTVVVSPPVTSRSPDVLPEAFPRIVQPDCARLESDGAIITARDSARCEVHRWFAAWDAHLGRPLAGDFALAVDEVADETAALALLERFESPMALRAGKALAYLREDEGAQQPERLDAGLLILRKLRAHTACIWRAYGARLPLGVKMPHPRLFIVPLAEFLPAWEGLWKLVQGGGWTEQAAVLGEWLAFNRTLRESRIEWSQEFPRLPLPGAEKQGGLIEQHLGYVLTRIWSLRRRKDPEVLDLWLKSRDRLEQKAAEMESKELATLRTWMALEGCLIRLVLKDLGEAMKLAGEARQALEACSDEPGAELLGISGWPEWRQLGSLGR